MWLAIIGGVGGGLAVAGGSLAAYRRWSQREATGAREREPGMREPPPPELGSMEVSEIVGGADTAQQRLILLSGRSGVGKSAIFNTLAGKEVSPSGFSIGGALTKENIEHNHDKIKNLTLVDTPVLYAREAGRSATAYRCVTDALTSHANIPKRVVFVFSTISGRNFATDFGLVQQVLEAAPGLRYSVVFNQTDTKLKGKRGGITELEREYKKKMTETMRTKGSVRGPDLVVALWEEGTKKGILTTEENETNLRRLLGDEAPPPVLLRRKEEGNVDGTEGGKRGEE
jgi:GTP-binding protein EngB required for normal cell division